MLSFCFPKEIYRDESFQPENWSSGHVFVAGAVDLRFKTLGSKSTQDSNLRFKTGQIGHTAVNGLPSLRHFFERSYVLPGRNKAEIAPESSLQCNERFDLRLESFQSYPYHTLLDIHLLFFGNWIFPSSKIDEWITPAESSLVGF